MSLHTRHKYGKLTRGFLVQVSPTLIRRAKSHFISLECGVDLIIGNNGYIWVSPTATNKRTSIEEDEDEEIDTTEKKKLTEENTIVHTEVRMNMARVRNAIVALSKMFMSIHPLTIQYVYMKSVELGYTPRDMLLPLVIVKVTQGSVDILSGN